jgi:dihydroflavonol-4-reductase
VPTLVRQGKPYVSIANITCGDRHVKTVVLTGITGFIAKRIALDLLEAGYSVRGSLRSQSRADEVRDALRPRLSDPAAFDRLSFVELDLGRDDGWTEAMEGCGRACSHRVSLPDVRSRRTRTPSSPGRRRHPARAAAAQAAGVTRVVLTSSVVAIEAKAKRGAFTEEDWTDIAHPKSTPTTSPRRWQNAPPGTSPPTTPRCS